MTRSTLGALGRALPLLALLAPAALADEAAPTTAIRAGKIVTMNAADEVIDHGVIIVRGGRIVALGSHKDVAIPAGATVVDASDRWVVPGFVDCHNHTAGSLRDLNDGVWLTNPGLRTLDALDPENEELKGALHGGVTTVLLIPGSGTNLSGFGTVARTAGRTGAEMARRAPGSLKIAQAGNPERYWFGVGRSYMNYNLRQTLEKARAYHRRWEGFEERGGEGAAPEKDLVWEDFRGVFRREVPVSVHTQMYQVVLRTLTMLHDQFELNVVLDHSTFDAFKLAPLIIEREKKGRLFTICGPRQYHFDGYERRWMGIAASYADAGVRELGINTDAPVVPQEELTLQAALGCRFGLDGYAALRALTIVPARALGVAKDVGSLEVGKEADLGVWTGDPIDPRSTCLKTIVGGKLVYDAQKQKNRRF